MKYILLFACGFLLCSSTSFAQRKPNLLSARISGQYDFDRAEYRWAKWPGEFKEYKKVVFNYGADVMAEIGITNKWSVSIGLGYFRNQFIQTRQYDHQLLNTGTDSLPIGTSVSNHVFHLARIPIGIQYRIAEKSKYKIDLGVENMINFSFLQVYNGGLPFPGANNRYSKLEYYGNSVFLFAQVSKDITPKSRVSLSPYIRLYNVYKRENPILYENTEAYYTRFCDAVGLSFKYSFNLKS